MVINGSIRNVFDWLKHINQYKTPVSSFTTEDWDKFDVFMIHRGLSQNKDLVELVSYVQSLAIQDKKQIYYIYRDLVPKNNKWNKWIKSTTKGENKELLKILSEFFECSIRRSSENFKLLSKEDLTKILQSTGIEEKEIKKLLK